MKMAVCSSGALGSAEWEDCLRQVAWRARLGDILRTSWGRLLRGHQWFPLVPATWFCAIVHPAYCCGTRRYLEYPAWPVLQGLVLPVDRGECQHCRCSEAHLCFRCSKGSPAWSHCPGAGTCSSPDVSMPLMSDLSFSVAEKEKPG